MAERQDLASTKWQSQNRHISIPLILVAVTVLTGTAGTYLHLTSLYVDMTASEVIVESIFTSFAFLVLNGGVYPIPGSDPPLLVYIGRSFGVLFISYAAVLGFGALFAERLKPHRILFWYYIDRLRPGVDEGHVVVCGIGSKGFDLARNLLAEGYRVVAIESAERTTNAEELQDQGAIILREDATRPRTIGQRGKAHLASEVFVNCGSDYTNVEVVKSLADWIDEQSPNDNEVPAVTLPCHVHLGERSHRHLLHDQMDRTPHIQLHTYDSASATARELLINCPVAQFEENPTSGRIHVTIVGWGDLSRALVYKLCQIMHYPEGKRRTITVICRDPAAARRDLHNHHSALDSQRWEDESTWEFAAELFPDIVFAELPADEDLLLSEQFALYDRLEASDTLTIIITRKGWLRSEALLSRVLPKLEAIERELGLDTEVHYLTPTGEYPNRQLEDSGFQLRSSVIDIQPFSNFVDECTPRTVRGEYRDQIAKQIALFFHLRYKYDPAIERCTIADQEIADLIPLDPPRNQGYDYETVVSLWERLDENQIMELAEVVWHNLSEHDRDSNRNAADHVPVKGRIAKALSEDTDWEWIIDALAEVEHQRWCAERLLDGWEPLDVTRISEWKTSAREELREQKLHLDIRPTEDLEQITDGEAEKDNSLVRFALEHLVSDDQYNRS